MIDYSEFLHSNGALANDGGPWQVYRSYPDDINSGSMQPFWCGDVAYCLSTWVFPCATRYTYTVSFYTDIAVNLSQYQGLSTLQYQWQYSAWWGTTKAVPGTKLPIRSGVGETMYNNTLIVGNYTRLFTDGTGWEDPPFQYNGSISLLPNSGRTTEHIHLAINFTFPRQDGEYINYYVKNVSFKITSPPTTVTSSTLPTFTPTLSTSSSSPNETSLHPTAPNPHNSTSITTTTTSTSTSNVPTNISIGAFVGGIIGAAMLTSCIMIGVFLCWRHRANKHDADRVAMEDTNSSRETIENPRIDPFNGDNENEEDYTPPMVPLILINSENNSARGQDGSMISEQTSLRASVHRLSTAYTAYESQVIDNPPAYVSSNSLARQRRQPEEGMSSSGHSTNGHQAHQLTQESTGISPGGRLTYAKQ